MYSTYQDASTISTHELVLSAVAHRMRFAVEFVTAIGTVAFGIAKPAFWDALTVVASVKKIKSIPDTC